MRVILDSLRKRLWLSFLAVWAGLALVLVSWAISTPLGASPDEPAHIIKAASVARGELLGEPGDKPGMREVIVPASIAQSAQWPCYAFDPAVEATCIPPLVTDDELVPAMTTAGLYNPIYYAAVGWPSLVTDNAKVAVLGMRAMSALLSSFFLAVAFCALLQFRAPVITGVAFFAAATPTLLFLGGAVSPNALEVSAGSALIALLLALGRAPDPVRRVSLQLVLAGVSGFFLVNSRGLSPLWVLLIAVGSLVFWDPQRLKRLLRMPLVWGVLVFLAAVTALAGLWILNTGTLESMGSFPGAGQTDPFDAFMRMLLDRSFDPGLFAVFGWLDTVTPNFVPYFWAFLFFAVVIAALVLARGRAMLAVWIMIAGFLLVPPIVQALSVENSGYIWQGRYTLVAYASLLLLAGASVALFRPPALALVERATVRKAVVVVAIGVTFSQVFSVVVALRRYAVGVDGEWADFVEQPLWSPPGGIWLWPIVSLVGMALLMLAWAAWIRPSRQSSAAEAVSAASARV